MDNFDQPRGFSTWRPINAVCDPTKAARQARTDTPHHSQPIKEDDEEIQAEDQETSHRDQEMGEQASGDHEAYSIDGVTKPVTTKRSKMVILKTRAGSRHFPQPIPSSPASISVSSPRVSRPRGRHPRKYFDYAPTVSDAAMLAGDPSLLDRDNLIRLATHRGVQSIVNAINNAHAKEYPSGRVTLPAIQKRLTRALDRVALRTGKSKSDVQKEFHNLRRQNGVYVASRRRPSFKNVPDDDDDESLSLSSFSGESETEDENGDDPYDAQDEKSPKKQTSIADHEARIAKRAAPSIDHQPRGVKRAASPSPDPTDHHPATHKLQKRTTIMQAKRSAHSERVEIQHWDPVSKSWVEHLPSSSLSSRVPAAKKLRSLTHFRPSVAGPRRHSIMRSIETATQSTEEEAIDDEVEFIREQKVQSKIDPRIIRLRNLPPAPGMTRVKILRHRPAGHQVKVM